MINPRIAGRYAKSLLGLAIERNQVEVVYKDMQYILQVNKSSRDFVNVLKSPVIKADKKNSIITAVVGKNISELTRAFIHLLVAKGREVNFPEIVEAFIEQYNHYKEIHKVKLTTATAISEEVKKTLVSKVNAEAGFDKIDLETAIDEKLIGGFVLEFDNKLVDASILRDLKDIQKQFSQNFYVENIR